jgi:hypothetical protein
MMARARQADTGTAQLHRVMNAPGTFLRGMLVFVALVGFIIAIIWKEMSLAFWTNPLLNGLIFAVLVVGIIRAFGQVIRLYPEIRWVNAFRIADPGLAVEHRPVLLAPMATMLRDRRGQISLSTTAMRSLMDTLGGRLDESRDTGRYLVGLLVFLGLLGTFWGLLETMQSVGRAINALDTKQQDSLLIFEELKQNLAAPLKGMGTAFSSSLMGLAGSLVLGFLDLQTSHAHNRFYNELEEWLSGITELTPSAVGGDQASRQIAVAVYEMQRAVADLSVGMQGVAAAQAVALNGAQPVSIAASDQTVKELAAGVDQLVRQMRAEQKVVREWVDDQAARQAEVATALKDLAQTLARRGG